MAVDQTEYSLLDLVNHQATYKVEGGILYCDGVRVERWQLTDAELEKYFPKEAEAKLLAQLEREEKAKAAINGR